MMNMIYSNFRRIKTAVILSCLLSILVLVAACNTGQKPFKDYGYKPPADQYDGTLFKLSQNYPTTPSDSNDLPIFFATDYRNDWRTYMMQVRDYCFEGNTEVDWRVENNNVRNWYHMPWQDYGPAGREGIHGLTKEAPLSAYQLSAEQPYGDAVAYAIGFYNDFGGYTIGQVWKDHENPDPGVTSTAGFPNGTVVCKTLFVDMPPALVAEQVPFLVNPIEWQAYTTNGFSSTDRSVKEVTLIQMDIMIRDVRSPYGWIFGTFQYNGALNNANPWDNLVPVGLMWGNDPDYQANIPQPDTDNKFPPNPPSTQTPINAALKQTVINPDANELPPTHLGWDGRLNGPVDNPRSSCMSCHMTASFENEPLSPLFISPDKWPPSGTAEWDTWWMQWFQNVGWQNGELEKFLDAEYSLDFSLQLSAALQNFHQSEAAKTPVTPENPVQR
ncbi:MAG: hypothetical protein KC421_26740 [Anaerolineales bacterium]|nr:hypothetical protein [Anaerolineales bacterium]